MTKRRESPEQCDHSLLIGLQVAYPVEKNFCARLSAFCNVWSDLFRGESIGSASHTQHHTQLVQQPMNSKFAAASDQLLIAAPGLNGRQLELGDVSCNTPERLIVVSKSIRGADPSAAENPSAPSLDAFARAGASLSVDLCRERLCSTQTPHRSLAAQCSPAQLRAVMPMVHGSVSYCMRIHMHASTTICEVSWIGCPIPPILRLQLGTPPAKKGAIFVLNVPYNRAFQPDAKSFWSTFRNFEQRRT
jgi:hypothetical protein